mgnify:CR=1 FL=1
MPVFDTLVEALNKLPPAERTSLLEIGCSSGYYSEVLAARGIDARYHGCDYSKAFIELARRHYPALPFDVMDATQLGYAGGQFDVVVQLERPVPMLGTDRADDLHPYNAPQ